MITWSNIRELHVWFVRESRSYVGPYTWRTRLQFPSAWLRFMWYSLRDRSRNDVRALKAAQFRH